MTVSISNADVSRILLVSDQVVFIMKDGSVQHCDGTNGLIESIIEKGTPTTASTRIDSA